MGATMISEQNTHAVGLADIVGKLTSTRENQIFEAGFQEGRMEILKTAVNLGLERALTVTSLLGDVQVYLKEEVEHPTPENDRELKIFEFGYTQGLEAVDNALEEATEELLAPQETAEMPHDIENPRGTPETEVGAGSSSKWTGILKVTIGIACAYCVVLTGLAIAYRWNKPEMDA